MENYKTLELINNTLSFDQNQDSAVAYGLHQVGDSLSYEVIGRSPDVYDLIDDLSSIGTAKSFDYLSIITWGWAAPLNENGGVDGAPSKHPLKRRVKLVISGKNPDGLIGSVVNFSDDVENPVYDTGDATGSLNDAFVSLFAE